MAALVGRSCLHSLSCLFGLLLSGLRLFGLLLSGLLLFGLLLSGLLLPELLSEVLLGLLLEVLLGLLLSGLRLCLLFRLLCRQCSGRPDARLCCFSFGVSRKIN